MHENCGWSRLLFSPNRLLVTLKKETARMGQINDVDYLIIDRFVGWR
jgi:hypothetical protein